MSGLVPLSTIQDDFYVFDESRSNLVGRRTRRVIGLGDRLTVQVAKVDSFKKQVDFCLAAGEGKVAAPRPPGARPNAARPQQQQQRAKYPQSSRRDGKRPPPSNRDANVRCRRAREIRKRQDSRRQDARPGKSQTARRSDEHPQNPNKPATFQTSGSKFSTTQRPLIKASGSSRFSRRRR